MTWRGPSLGSVEPGAWKKLDARLKTALSPLHEALNAARLQARQQREALIVEAEALGARAAERDTPARVKELQARWQTHAKSIVLAQRDERTLWERFRAACNAVFDARTGSRKEADERRHVQRTALEALCEQMEQLAQSTDADEAKVRSSLRELQEQWRRVISEGGPTAAAIEARFKTARTGVEDLLRGRSRASEAAIWQTLFAKEQLCEELDAFAISDASADPTIGESVQQRWSALPPLATDWEQKLLKRRDTTLNAFAPLADAYAREDLADDIKKSASARRDALLELELMLGLESPADLQKERLAVQVKHLRDRFKRTTLDTTGGAVEVLLRWCALPGVAEARDRQRCERIVASLQRRR